MTANNIGTLEVGFFSALIGADNTMFFGGIIIGMITDKYFLRKKKFILVTIFFFAAIT